MLLIPALYIRDKKTVRLEGGRGPFDEDPARMAMIFAGAGAEMIYIVDLNAPATGAPPNLSLIEKIAKESRLKINLTGNIRSNDVAERYFKAGAERIVLSAIAYQKPDFLKGLCQKYPGKIGVHIEVVHGRVVIKGWTVAAKKTALDYAEQFRDAGVGVLLYSDAESEGKITAADVGRIIEFSRNSPLPVIHGTDISAASELDLVLGLESGKIIGTILGKSVYSGIVDLAATITHLKEETPSGMDEPTLIP